jgi:RHS repeat-associated protein
MNMHGLSNSASLAKPNAYKFNGGTELTKDFGWQMYDTPFRSYDAQLGRFHQIDPLADLAPGINPYRFGFNNPISLNDPTGLYEGRIQDIFDEAWARTSGDVGCFNFNNGSLNRDTSIENDINWVVDFVTTGQGTAEFVMGSGGGGFWLHYNPSFVGGYVSSRNEHVGAIIQKRSLFFRLGAQGGGGNPMDNGLSVGFAEYLGLGLDVAGDISNSILTDYIRINKEFGGVIVMNTAFKTEVSRLKSANFGIKWGGRALGLYNAYSIDQQFREGSINQFQRITEQGTNVASTLGGYYGAAWGVGWEIGRGITQIPAYQSWKQKTWYPWRERNLGY